MKKEFFSWKYLKIFFLMFVVICLKNFETKELRTKRLILRKFTLDDAKDMFNNYGSDSDASKYLVEKMNL